MNRRSFMKNINWGTGLPAISPLSGLFEKDNTDDNDQSEWIELIDYACWSPLPYSMHPLEIEMNAKMDAGFMVSAC